MDQTKSKMRELACLVDASLNNGLTEGERNGFVILAFPAAEPGMVNYISNCSREDVVNALIALVARLKRQL